MPPLLEARGLTKHYGSVIALESVDFQVVQGITGLLGPNGAGKSTAIKLFLGLLRPTRGSAEIMGQHAYESVEARTRLGYMPEHRCLPPSVTATEFLTHMAQVSGLPPRPRPNPHGRHPAAGRPRRGALPLHRRILHRHAPAREARPGPRSRSRRRSPRRAHGGPGPRRTRGDAGAHQAHRARVRHQHHALLPPDGRRRERMRPYHRSRRRQGDRTGRCLSL